MILIEEIGFTQRNVPKWYLISRRKKKRRDVCFRINWKLKTSEYFLRCAIETDDDVDDCVRKSWKMRKISAFGKKITLAREMGKAKSVEVNYGGMRIRRRCRVRGSAELPIYYLELGMLRKIRREMKQTLEIIKIDRLYSTVYEAMAIRRERYRIYSLSEITLCIRFSVDDDSTRRGNWSEKKKRKKEGNIKLHDVRRWTWRSRRIVCERSIYRTLLPFCYRSWSSSFTTRCITLE